MEIVIVFLAAIGSIAVIFGVGAFLAHVFDRLPRRIWCLEVRLEKLEKRKR